MSSFDEVRLPTNIERNALGGPGFLTNIVMLNSGKEQRNSLWSVDRGQWDVSYGIQTREEALAVRDFFMARVGKARGFRFRDWTNYRVEVGYEMPLILLDVAPAGRVFQMYYRYADTGGYYYDKPIYKPMSGTITTTEAGITIAPEFRTVGHNTGKVTFDTAPIDPDVMKWRGLFDLPVRFDTDTLAINVVTVENLIIPSIPIVELKL